MNLERAAQRILNNYRETGFDANESTDNAVVLAVHYGRLGKLCDDLLRAYNERDDVLFDKTLRAVKGTTD